MKLKLPYDQNRERCAEGVAQALLRDYTENSKRIGAEIEDIEARLVALAKKRGMSDAEIRQALDPTPAHASGRDVLNEQPGSGS